MTYPVLWAVVFVFILLPFLPGLWVIWKSRDASPLDINMAYTKDPRYFGKSFRAIVRGMELNGGKENGREMRQLSKLEDVERSSARTVSAGASIRHVLLIDGDLVAQNGAKFDKEIYASGRAAIGEKNSLRALACDGDVVLGRETRIFRWVDADGDIVVEKGCRLGLSVSCGGTLRLHGGCGFKRLYGLPIKTVGIVPKSGPGEEDAGASSLEISDAAWIIDGSRIVIPRSAAIAETIIAKNNLVVGNSCTLKGDVKSYQNVVLGNNVVVNGNVFAEGDVEIKNGVRIVGNVFSQGRVIIGERVRIGEPGTIKSVIGKKGIALGRDFEQFGYVFTEGEGTTV